jgi:hypothetical protein
MTGMQDVSRTMKSAPFAAAPMIRRRFPQDTASLNDAAQSWQKPSGELHQQVTI